MNRELVPGFLDFREYCIFHNPIIVLSENQMKLAKAFIDYRVLHHESGSRSGRTTVLKHVNSFFEKFYCPDFDVEDAQLMGNHEAYLGDMLKRYLRLLGVLDDIEYALSPDFVFDFWNENVDKDKIPRPTDLQGGAIIRCKKAMEVLREYRNS